MDLNKKRLKGVEIARVGTVPFSLTTQLNNTLEYLEQQGANVTAISSDDSSLGVKLTDLKVNNVINVNIAREINLYLDLKALIKLCNIFYKNKFNIVHSTTPKAGLLVSIASFFTRVPVRLHTFTGQAWANSSGLKKRLLIALDWLIVKLNTKCYTDSQSQKDYLIEHRIAKSEKICVLGKGSLAGVDINRFRKERFSQENIKEFKLTNKLSLDSFILLFIGRVTRDKGIVELIEAANNIISRGLNLELLIVGPQESGFEIEGTLFEQYIDNQKNIHYVGFTSDPEKFYSLADVFCLPSYREGFGTVIIEAGAMGVPTIGSDIYGVRDAIQNGHTGLLVPPKSIKSIETAIEALMASPENTKIMGDNAKERVHKNFSTEILNKLLVDEYLFLLNN
jgi:glycosyltransferase involved in cell wall biosynthesis